MSVLNTNAQSFIERSTTMDNYQSTNFNGYSLNGQPLPEGNHTLSGQMNGGYHHNQTNRDMFSGGGTHNTSAEQIKNEPMDTTTSGSLAKQEAVQRLREELQSHAKEEPKPNLKDEPKIPIKDKPTDNKYITVLIRGQGTNTKALQIKRTALLDELITEVNSSSGFGRNPGNTYIVVNGKELSSGTGKTVEQFGIRDTSIVEICVRTVGG